MKIFTNGLGLLPIFGMVILTTILGLACFPVFSVDTSNSPAVDSKSLDQEKLLETSLDKMEQEFILNSAMAKAKYDNKYVKVSGRLIRVNSIGTQLSIIKATDTDKAAFMVINCRINTEDKAQKDYFQNAQIGQKVTVCGHLNDIKLGQGYVYTMKVERFE